MFSTNSKKFIRKIAVADLKSNKLKMFLSGVMILLATCLLITFALVTYNSSRDLITNRPYHVMYQAVEMDTKDALVQNSNFSKTGIYKYLGGLLENDYTLDLAYADSITFELMDFELISGTIPLAENEIAISAKYLEKTNSNAKPGDKITLIYRDNFTNKEVSQEFIISGLLRNYYQDQANQYFGIVSEVHVNQIIESEVTQTSIFSKERPNTVDVVAVLSEENIKNGPNAMEEILKKIGSSLNIPEYGIVLNYSYISGDSGDSSSTISAIIMGLLVVFSSIFVIYSIFYISVVNSVQIYAKMIALGMTSKQLKKLIAIQGNILSAVFIPIGIILSCIITYIFQPRMWLMEDIPISILLGVVMLITVKVSLLKPAKIVSKITAIEAMKYVEGITAKNKQKAKKLSPKYLADNNLRNNRKKGRMTLVSLCISGVLFISVALVMNSLDYKNYARSVFEYEENYIIGIKLDNFYERLKEIQQNNPLSDELVHELENIQGVKKVIKNGSVIATLTEPDIRDSDGNVIRTTIDNLTPEFVECYSDAIVKGTMNYSELDSDSIIINQAMPTIKKNGMNFIIGDKITFLVASGQEEVEKVFTVKGIVSIPQNSKAFLVTSEALEDLTPFHEITNLSIICEEGTSDAIGNELRDIVQSDPNLTLRVYDDELAMLTRGVQMLVKVVYGLVLIIVCFGIINLINMLVSSILVRKKEFALLQAVGMTQGQLRQMLYFEGLNYSIKAVFVSAILGVIGGNVLCTFLKSSMGLSIINFHFSAVPILLFALILVGLQMLISYIISNNIVKKTLTDRLRMN